jgi:hypothetical protein
MVRPTGVPWLDDTGELAAVVRLSRAAGLPPPLPDVFGLAMRADLDGRWVDLLLSSSGVGAVTRALLVPRRDGATTYGSLMTYGSPAGRVSLLAVAESPLETGAAFVLAAAFGFGPFEPYARLRLGPELGADGADPRRAFDAVLHAPPGLAADGVVARFRTPAYAAVREARDARLAWAASPVVAESASRGTEGV